MNASFAYIFMDHREIGLFDEFWPPLISVGLVHTFDTQRPLRPRNQIGDVPASLLQVIRQ